MADEKDLKAQIAEHEAIAKNEALHPDLREHHRAQALLKRQSRKTNDDERTGTK